MPQHSKRFRECLAKVAEAGKPVYTIEEAIAALQGLPKTKFDQSVEVHLRLGIDAKQSDQTIRGSVSLPAGLGRSRRVVAFVDGPAVEEAKKAGAVEAGGDDLIARIQQGWTDFDVAVAHPSMMPKVGKLGRVLGPQGKMPNPKTGTVAADVVAAVREFTAGKVEFRNDDTGNVHAVVGKLSFETGALKQNIEAFIEHIRRMKPVSAKGVFVRAATLSATMSPGLHLAI